MHMEAVGEECEASGPYVLPDWIVLEGLLLAGALLYNPKCKTSSKVQVIAEMTHSIAATDFIPDMEFILPQHEVVPQRAGDPPTVDGARILRKEDREVGLSRVRGTQQQAYHVIEVAV
jgi:hypothetical protein